MTHQNISRIQYTTNMLNQNHNSASLDTFLKLARAQQRDGTDDCLCQIYDAKTVVKPFFDFEDDTTYDLSVEPDDAAMQQDIADLLHQLKQRICVEFNCTEQQIIWAENHRMVLTS